MEPTPNKPTKKRRRWLIVAFVVVLVSAVSWYWPRRDARFVGKWDASGNPWEFRANGIVATRNPWLCKIVRPVYMLVGKDDEFDIGIHRARLDREGAIDLNRARPE